MKKILFFAGLCLFLAHTATGQSSCLPGTSCSNAPLFCGYTLQNNVFNNGGYPPGDVAPNCGNDFDNHNSQWFKIIPCSTPLALHVEVLTTDNLDGLQIALYQACENYANVTCNPGQPFGAFSWLPIVVNVTPGEEYYIQIDGYNGDVCDYRIIVDNGLPVIAPDIPNNSAPTSGTINSVPSGNAFCAVGVATFDASWPGCDTLTFTNPLGCYSYPLPDTCGRLDWDFPQGTIYLSDSTASPVSVSFSNVLPGTYTIKVRPRPCVIPAEEVCPLCLPLPCPVEELSMQISIIGASVNALPPISLCASDWPPACNTGTISIGSDSILCIVSADASTCSMVAQPYILSTNDTLCPPACSNYNLPAPPGDECADAPLFCGNFLEGYCSSNEGMSTDTLVNGAVIEHAAFIRIPTCSDSLDLTISVKNCHLGQGLTFYTMSGSCPDLHITSSLFIADDTALTLNSTVAADSIWYLVAGGGDECEFRIDTVAGIGTATIVPPTCSCQDGYINGPSDLCAGDVATFTIVFPQCEVLDPGGIEGGNGYICCPPLPGSQEEWHYVWHTTHDLMIVGDSVDVTSVQIEVNPDLIGLDTTFPGLVFLTYQPLSGLGTPDTLTFCGCLTPGCGGNIPPKPVNIHHNVNFFSCELTCSAPTCTAPNGQEYSSPGSFTESTNCETWIITITQDQVPPFLDILPVSPICQGDFAVLEAVVSATSVGIQWSTGENSTIILVSPSATTTYQVVATDWNTGCTTAAAVLVEVHPLQVLQLGELGKISCSQPCVETQFGPFCSPGSFSMQTENCQVFLFSIGVDNSLTQVTLPPIYLCQGECVEVNGATWCQATTVQYTSNCVQYTQQIAVVPPQVIDLGQFTLTCAQPCVTTPLGQYCTPGIYEVPTGTCELTRLTVVADTVLPEVVLPPIHICPDSCAEVNGGIYCENYVVQYVANCTKYIQEIILDPHSTVDLGQFPISCAQPCAEVLGQAYCAEGLMSDTVGCTVYSFEIVFQQDTVQQGQVGLITCQQTCVAWNGNDYCLPGIYSTEDACFVYIFTINISLDAPGYSGVAHQCLPDNNSYYVTCTITGTPPFKVNGNPVAGNYFESSPYNNGDSYQFLIEQTSNGCQTVLAGQYNCAALCPGAAAVLSGNTVTLCGNGTVAAEIISPAVISAGNAQEFLLHTGSSPASGIVQRSANGVFELSSMQWEAGQQYYITAVAGPDNGSGMVDLNHTCTHISAPQPFIWNMPVDFGSIAAEAPDCQSASNGWIYLNDAPPGAQFRLDNSAWSTEDNFGPLISGDYTLSMQESNGCLSDTLVTIPESDSLTLMITGNSPVHHSETTVLTATSNAASAMFEWVNQNNGVQYNAPIWTVAITEDTRFFCTVTTAPGCTDTASLWIQVLPEGIYYPNVIQPESTDNRWFSISAAPYYVKKGISMNIFDRWGNAVFSAAPFEVNVPEAGWDGSNRGKRVAPGVYTFVAEVELYNGVLRHLTGSITVVR